MKIFNTCRDEMMFDAFLIIKEKTNKIIDRDLIGFQQWTKLARYIETKKSFLDYFRKITKEL